jgi:hypothetical protein
MVACSLRVNSVSINVLFSEDLFAFSVPSTPPKAIAVLFVSTPTKVDVFTRFVGTIRSYGVIRALRGSPLANLAVNFRATPVKTYAPDQVLPLEY